MHNFCYLCSIKRNIFRSERIALHIAPIGNWTLCLMAESRRANVIRCFLPVSERELYAIRIPQYIGGLCQTTATAIRLDGCPHFISNRHTKRRQSLTHTPSGTRFLVVASKDKHTGFACSIAIRIKPYRTQYQSNSGTITNDAT